MTDFQAETAIGIYQREQRKTRNRQLQLALRHMHTAEQFFFALRSLNGINTVEREGIDCAEFFQTFA